MKKLILILLVLSSCKNTNDYELALNEYIKEDLHFKQARINYQLEQFDIRSLEIPSDLNHKNKNKEAKILNKLCLRFENRVFNTKNLDTINKLLINLKTSILKQKFTYLKFVEKEVEELPIKLKSDLEKYNLLRKIKELNYRINGFDLNIYVSGMICGLGVNHSSVLATRINDNKVLINIYSEIAKGYSKDFDKNSLSIKKLQDHNNNEVNILGRNDDIIESYIVETKSDTLYLDAILKTNELTGLLVSENNSYIIIGEHKIFDTNHLDDYFDFYRKK
ncbi:hypothetical protein [Psychroserpens luteus]|uniref:Lipoprotein n=1 Tax=Psychroserpens luteus TaxID=1434066 RepID=A0ABW5ZY57_9FLAO|nr:hypothetical protein [Psychroserpens luteus]